MQQKIVNITAVQNHVDAWAGGVAQGGCNAKQAEVCKKVASQVIQEISSESRCGGLCMADPVQGNRMY